MTPQLPPFLRLRESDPQYEREVQAYFAGTFQSAWTFFVEATASNIAYTLVHAKELIQFHRWAVERGQRPAETLSLAKCYLRRESA